MSKKTNDDDFTNIRDDRYLNFYENAYALNLEKQFKKVAFRNKILFLNSVWVFGSTMCCSNVFDCVEYKMMRDKTRLSQCMSSLAKSQVTA